VFIIKVLVHDIFNWFTLKYFSAIYFCLGVYVNLNKDDGLYILNLLYPHVIGPRARDLT
jgi:hypothetical protein